MQNFITREDFDARYADRKTRIVPDEEIEKYEISSQKLHANRKKMRNEELQEMEV